MGFTRGTDYSTTRTWKDVISDEALEKLLEQKCCCSPKDSNFWYIKDDKDRKSIKKMM